MLVKSGLFLCSTFMRVKIAFIITTLLLCGFMLTAETLMLTNHFGTEIEAELIELKEDGIDPVIVFKRVADGRNFEYPLSDLVEEDRQAIKTWWKKAKRERETLTADVSLEITYKTNRKKETLVKDSYYDHDRFIFTPEVAVTNSDFYNSYTGNTIHIVSFTEHQRYRGRLCVASTTTKKLDLPPNSTERVLGESYDFVNIDYNYADMKDGFAHAGYLIVIKNSQGKVTHVRSSKQDFENHLNKILEAKKDTFFSTDFSQTYDSYL